MQYGATIGKKFYEDGRVRHYPGNTVVAAILPESDGYPVLAQLRQWVIDEGLSEQLILMPEDSYHMTLLRGVNDQVRHAPYWPEALPQDTPMPQVDDYITAAIAKAALPGKVRMKFDSVGVSKTCMVVRLKPADGEQERILRQFRDRGAENIGVFFPGHETYTFHITLAYVRIVPEGTTAEKLEQLKRRMDNFLTDQPEFYTGQPYMAYYDDMLRFHPERIPRD